MTSNQNAVISTGATHSFTVSGGAERPPNFAFALAFLAVIPKGNLRLPLLSSSKRICGCLCLCLFLPLHAQQPHLIAFVPPTLDTLPRNVAGYDVVPMSFRQQTAFYARHAVDPGSLVTSVFHAAFQMAFPPRTYPREWRDGGAAFGRNVGDAVAGGAAAQTGRYLAGYLLHEDPRYYPSTSPHKLRRFVHALTFTVVNASDHGHPRLAVSNLAGAAAGAFISRAYLPDGFRDATHTGQRTLGIFVGYAQSQTVGFATQNLLTEFTPDLKSIAQKLHVPFVH